VEQRVDNIGEIIGLLSRSGLTSEEDASRCFDTYAKSCVAINSIPDGITAFCIFLISTGVVTPWQCDKLRQGKWKGFFYQEFEFLDCIGVDYNYSYYLAKDTRTNSYVRLRMSPASRYLGNQTECHVEHIYGSID
jgi:hypothetical protein